MPITKHRSKTFRIVYRKTPGGRTVVHYKRRKPQKAHCAGCQRVLAGVPRELPYRMKAIQRTRKRPERPLGGSYCSACMRRILIIKARA